MPLDRDVIFVSEAGEEASTGPGIEYLVGEHWKEIEAEICLAEGAECDGSTGQVSYALVQDTEKQPRSMRLIAHRAVRTRLASTGETNAVLHLARAVEKISMWDPPCASTHYPVLLRKAGQRQQAGRCPLAIADCSIRRRRPRFGISGRERSRRLYYAPYVDLAQYLPGRLSGECDSVRSAGDRSTSAHYPTKTCRFHGADAKGLDDPSVEIVPRTKMCARERRRHRSIPTRSHAIEPPIRRSMAR